MGQKFWEIFLPPFLELKVDFSSDWRRIRKCVFIKHSTTQFQYTHELVHGFTIKNLLVTLLRVQIKLTLHRVHDAACEVVVLHGGCLCLPTYYSAFRRLCQPLYSEIDEARPVRASMPP
jgi:hypothetical protein